MLLRPRRASEHCFAVRNSVSDADTGRVVKTFCRGPLLLNGVAAWAWYLARYWRFD